MQTLNIVIKLHMIFFLFDKSSEVFLFFSYISYCHYFNIPFLSCSHFHIWWAVIEYKHTQRIRKHSILIVCVFLVLCPFRKDAILAPQTFLLFLFLNICELLWLPRKDTGFVLHWFLYGLKFNIVLFLDWLPPNCSVKIWNMLGIINISLIKCFSTGKTACWLTYHNVQDSFQFLLKLNALLRNFLPTPHLTHKKCLCLSPKTEFLLSDVCITSPIVSIWL